MPKLRRLVGTEVCPQALCGAHFQQRTLEPFVPDAKASSQPLPFRGLFLSVWGEEERGVCQAREKGLF